MKTGKTQNSVNNRWSERKIGAEMKERRMTDGREVESRGAPMMKSPTNMRHLRLTRIVKHLC